MFDTDDFYGSLLRPVFVLDPIVMLTQIQLHHQMPFGPFQPG